MVKISPSSFLEYLPAIYESDPFVGQFLLAFEKILLGRNDQINFSQPGLEQTIAAIANLFDPKETPEEFISWLAGWTAFSVRADLTPVQQRDFIAKIIPLYRRRGTKENLQKLLEIFIKGKPTIIENEATESPEIERPHFFRVIVSLPRVEPALLARQLEITRALIELEKPAHTYYELEYVFPSMQIGKHSTIGVDTVLGSATENQT